VITAFVAERVTVVEATNEHAEKLQARLPEGLYAAPFYDAAEIYRDRLALLPRNARIGLVLGMLIDDAIVVGEAIYKHRSESMGRLEASITGVREVARPVVFAILTTCMSFAPMLMIPGAMGKFFSVLRKLVIIVLLISLAESLFVLPAHHQDAPGDDELRRVVEWQAPEAVHEARCDESVAHDGDV